MYKYLKTVLCNFTAWLYTNTYTSQNTPQREDSISFSAMKATEVRETLAMFQQPPLPFSVPQQATRLLSTGNIFHGKGSVTL